MLKIKLIRILVWTNHRTLQNLITSLWSHATSPPGEISQVAGRLRKVTCFYGSCRYKDLLTEGERQESHLFKGDADTHVVQLFLTLTHNSCRLLVNGLISLQVIRNPKPLALDKEKKRQIVLMPSLNSSCNPGDCAYPAFQRFLDCHFRRTIFAYPKEEREFNCYFTFPSDCVYIAFQHFLCWFLFQ